MDTAFIITLIIVSVISILVGYLFAYIQGRNGLDSLRVRNTELETTISLERQAQTEKLAELEKARQQMSESFAALAGQALKHNSDEFLKLANENLKQFQSDAVNALDKKEIAFANLVKPIRETLDKTGQQIHEMEKERKQSYGALQQHLEGMALGQSQLQQETRNLVQALRRPEVRGQWGEITLKRLAELAGMVEHCDFYEQENITTEQGRLRPDMIVRLPGKREIVVDVKTPLDAYLNAVECNDDEMREQQLKRHAQKVRERIRELAAKSYWSQFENAPDFVVLFIPGDQFLSAALEREPSLLEDAMAQQIILATPSSLVALLRAVAYGWRQEVLAENADKIRSLGETLYERIAAFSTHLRNVGNSLGSSIEHYNKAVGSFDTRILPSARRFTEMGLNAKKQLKQPEPIDKLARSIADRNEEPD